MLTLKITERGHLISLPGMAPFRTPATIDVSKIPLNVLIMKLKVYNIHGYEIISELGDQKIVYKKEELEKIKEKDLNKIDKKFVKHFDKRLNKLENIIKGLMKPQSKPEVDINLNKEQIKNVIAEILDQPITKEVDTEEDEIFIPPINTTGMKLKSSEHKIIKQKENLEDSADLLSEIQKEKK
jgi:hypothetical protein